MRRGFGLIEILVISAIIVVAVGGITALMASTTRGTRQSANRVIASYLAEEGLELMRHVRRQNINALGDRYDFGFAAGTYAIDIVDDNRDALSNFSGHAVDSPKAVQCDFSDGLTDQPNADGDCRLWTQNDAAWLGVTIGPCLHGYFHNFGWPSPEKLCFSDSYAFVPTPFYRLIKATDYSSPTDCPQPNTGIDIPGCKKIESIVAWEENAMVRTVSVSTFFYDDTPQ